MNYEKPDFSAIGAMTRGDEHAARRLRASMAVIARRTEDASLRALIVSVLAGDQSVRRVYEHPAFWAMFSKNFDNLQRGLDQLDDEQREDVMSRVGVDRVDDEDLDGLNVDPAPPPPPDRGRRPGL